MYELEIEEWSKYYSIDPVLIRAFIRKESTWRKYAYRVEKGFWTTYFAGIKRLFVKTPQKDDRWLTYPDIVSASYGLMQIMLSTAMERGFRFEFPFELFEPDTNIKWGCAHIKYLYDRYGSWNDVIAAYNQGNNRKRSNGRYVNQEAYVDIVLTYWKEEKTHAGTIPAGT
ncbi:MAG: transglycosylase SLT domain-containing protein [Sphaerochaeta sp.]|jgi:soluble lytic murein transglycosylase-like protein|nr:transglycosylase SLT domain-containing protein [Sphaerochaeta sp.]